MPRLLMIAAIVATCLLATLAIGSAEDPPIAAEPASFAFAIGDGNLSGGPEQVAVRLGGFELVVVDGELATAREVAALQAQGTTVLGYLSVGTIEKWRSWFDRIKRFRLAAWQDWKDEWYADVSEARLRRELAGRIAPELVAKGFDGLFLDNVDMVETRKYRDQRDGMRKLVLELSALAQGQGGLLFAQNGLWGLQKMGLVEALDGWNREDVTWTYDFDRRRYVRNSTGATAEALAELKQMGALGLTTTTADYTRAGDTKARDEAVVNACAAGALPYVGDIGLTARRLPDPPLTCP